MLTLQPGHRLNFMFELGLKLDNKSDLKNRVLKIADEKSSVLVTGRINEYVMTPTRLFLVTIMVTVLCILP